MRGEVRIGRSIYGVVVIDGSLCSRVYGMTLQDIAIDSYSSPSVMQVAVKASKTDQLRQGICLYVGRTRDSLCPVAAMMAFLSVRGAAPGPLFVFADSSPLTRERLVALTKSTLETAGLDPSGYSGHSFRIGAATVAAARGFEDSMIQTLGRWRSECFKRYVKIPRQQLARLSVALLG